MQEGVMHLLESISASAGSGKTFALALRYIALLSQGANPSSILALTFTKKAAKEMKERVIELLEALSYDTELQKSLEDSGGEMVDFRALKEEFLLSEDRIVTIDSFFSSILRKFCFYAGVRGDFEISSSRRDEFMEFFLSSLNSKSIDDIISFCYHQGMELERFIELLEEFDVDSALEFEKCDFSKISLIEKRVQDILTELDSAVKEYEKASASALKTFKYHDFDELSKKIKSSTPKWLVASSLSEYHYFKKLEGIDRYDHLLEEIKLLLKEHYRLKELYEINMLLSFHEEYSRIKLEFIKRKNSLSFSDVEELLELLLDSKGIERDFLYFRLDGEIEHILIDEFQDTNLPQYKLLLPLIEEIKSGIGRKEFRSFFIVGDKKQSIYRFRGANPYLFDLAAKRLHKSYLQINRRSPKNIISFVNEVFENKIENYLPQKSLSDEDRGYLHIKSGEDIESEVYEEVKKLLESGVEANDIAILSFKNDDLDRLSSTLYERFEGRVEFETDLSSKLINAKDVSAIISALKALILEDELYKKEFISLCGEELKISQAKKPLTTVLEIIKAHSLFSYNTLRFAEIASRYDDIKSLLQELENIDDSIIGNPKEGIKLQTIHKSKGLDYNYVIVVDSIGGEKNSYKNINLIYDQTKLADIKIRQSGREYFDDAYDEFLQSEKLKDRDDKLNTLYVAFTRAREGLSIIQKTKGSRLEILELKDKEIGNITPSSKKDRSSKVQKNYEFLETHLGAQKDFNKEEIKHEDNYSSIYKGLALHLMLENSKGVEVSQNSKELAYGIYGLYVDDFDEVAKEIDNFKTSSLASKIEGARIYTEISFFSGSISGRIDMLALKDDRAYIIDFKSGGESKEYQNQLDRYKKGIEDILGVDVETELYFIKERSDGLF
jgi:exodeoxyribonuclease V beta subunit